MGWGFGGRVRGQHGPQRVPLSLSFWVSPTGMTEHTKNLLRAFYELSQTHRGKDALNLLHDPGKNPALWAQHLPTPPRGGRGQAPLRGLSAAQAQADPAASDLTPDLGV